MQLRKIMHALIPHEGKHTNAMEEKIETLL